MPTAFTSKLPEVGTTIFTIMSTLARETGALNLSQGFPDYDGPELLTDLLCKHVKDGHNQYPPMTGIPDLREAIAEKLHRFYQVNADPGTEITVVPGATEAIFCAITASVNRGDEVIIFDPCYDSYEPAIRLAGGKARHILLRAGDFSVDWDRVREAINRNTRMIIINTPHNPTGAILQQEDMLTLQSIAEEHDLLVISDEVYEHLVFDGEKHCSVLQYPALAARSFAVFSFGKTFHVTGWKTGYCVAPSTLSREMRKVHQYVTFVGVTPIQMALADFMRSEPDYPAALAEFYQSKRDLFCKALEPSRFQLIPSSGTYFQLLEYSEISQEEDTKLAMHFTREHRVASIPISVLCEESYQQRFLRLCFAKNNDTLLEAAERLCAI